MWDPRTDLLWADRQRQRRLTAKANRDAAARRASLELHSKSQDELENNPEVWKVPKSASPPKPDPDRQLRRQVQEERLKFDKGTMVVMSAPQTFSDTFVGEVLGYEWQGDDLMVRLMVDPLRNAGDKRHLIPPRDRGRIEEMPQFWVVKADAVRLA